MFSQSCLCILLILGKLLLEIVFLLEIVGQRRSSTKIKIKKQVNGDMALTKDIIFTQINTLWNILGKLLIHISVPYGLFSLHEILQTWKLASDLAYKTVWGYAYRNQKILINVNIIRSMWRSHKETTTHLNNE